MANQAADPAIALRNRCSRIVRKMLRCPGKDKAPIEFDFDTVDDIVSETYTRTLAAYRRNQYAPDAVSSLIWNCARTSIADHIRVNVKSVTFTDFSADSGTNASSALDYQAYRNEEGEPVALPSGYLKRIDYCTNPTHSQGKAYDRAYNLKITAIALSKGLCYADTARLLGIAESSLRERRHTLADIFETRSKKTTARPAG
jgi:hypothetical protein